MKFTESPIVGIFFKLVGVMLILNRIMYTISTYKKMQIERHEDVFLKTNFCNSLDHRDMGRHTTICLEADWRLASSVIFHTLKTVIDDTLYRELHFHTIAQVTGIFTGVIVIGALHSKYIKGNKPMDLPTRKLEGFKID
jgi:hypothetical protein